MWKSTHIAYYPIKTQLLHQNEDISNTSSVAGGLVQEVRLTHLSQKTNINDATHIWNLALLSIKNCESLYSAKKAIKSFVLALPV